MADKKGQRGMIRAQERHRNLPGYPWKDTLGLNSFSSTLESLELFMGS